MLIKNLADHNMTASSISANQPSDARYVIVQDYIETKLMTAGARYVSGAWIGAASNRILPSFSKRAIWTESYLSEYY